MIKKYTAVSSKPERELKDIAISLFNGEIYTSFSINENERHHMSQVFMPLLFMGPREPFTGDVDVARLRANRIWELLEKDDEEKTYKEEFLPSIGLVYEYFSAGTAPRCINGMPIFFSCRFLNLEDTDKLRDYYEQYTKIRETADKF